MHVSCAQGAFTRCWHAESASDSDLQSKQMCGRAKVIVEKGFVQRMLRKRSWFDVDTQLPMPEEAFHALFMYSGLAELERSEPFPVLAIASSDSMHWLFISSTCAHPVSRWQTQTTLWRFQHSAAHATAAQADQSM